MLNSLEHAVIQMLLAGDDEVLAVLRQQAEHAKVTSRKMTGTGFYTEFAIPSETSRVAGDPTFKLGDINGRATNIKHELGFLLYVSKGVITMLEGYTYDEAWPDRINGLVLEYSGGQNRNLNDIKRCYLATESSKQ
jgi:hypothetical protein